jgi:transposase InsO family protein
VLTIQQEIQRIFLKEKRICELDSFLSQAARWYVCERTPYSLCSLDQTTYYLLAAWNTRRSYKKQIRAHSGKCALTTTTHHAQAAGETASMHEDGSNPPRALSKGCSGMVAQQLREATPYGQVPKYLIRDNDSKFGSCFAHVATTSAIEILKTPYHAPRANAICERFLRSVRQECLDHLFILHEKRLQRVLNEYVAYFNQARPHQGIKQQIPELPVPSVPLHNQRAKVIAVPVLGGLHHDYRRVA